MIGSECVEERIHKEKKKYRLEFLKQQLGAILSGIEPNKRIAVYGGGNSFQLIKEQMPERATIKYVIDRERQDGCENHIFPDDIGCYDIDVIIVSAWYSHEDMKYELYKRCYRGVVIDIYEEMKKKGIDLCQPITRYTDDMSADSIMDNRCHGIGKESAVHAEFYLIDAFEIFQFLPTYRHLEENGINIQFIAEPNEINMSLGWFDFDSAIKILEEKGVRYDIVCNPYVDFAFTTQTNTILSKYHGKKIRYAYGNSMTKAAMSNSERVVWGFDYSFVAGEWRKKLLSCYVDKQEIITMGYPKYVPFFAKHVDREKVLGQLGINTDKKILCYYPTWGEHSTIPMFSSYIKELKKEYFIVTKAHHCTYRLESELPKLNRLYDISDVVLEGNFDFALSTLIGDINICDAKSGAATEVPYLNPFAKVLYIYDNKKNDFENALFEDIFEIGPVTDKPWEIKGILESDMPGAYINKREERLKYIFGNRGTDYIENILKALEKK